MLLPRHMPPADQENRRVGVQRIRQPCDGIRDAGAGGDESNTETPRQPGVGISGVGSGLLVADVDDLYALGNTAVDDGKDVPPRQHEDRVHAFGSQGSRHGSSCLDLAQHGPIRRCS